MAGTVRGGAAPVAFADLPAEVPAGLPLPIWCDVASVHPSDQLLIRRRHGDREYPPLRATPAATGGAAGCRRWLATLPPLGVGEGMSFTPTLTRSGLVVTSLATRTLAGQQPAALRPEPAADPQADLRLATGVIPRYQWASEFLGALTIQLAKPPESFGPVPEGLNITFYIASGEIHGPRINAKVRGEGGDWMLVRRDGVGMADVRITYEADDGALLLSRYYGIFDLGPDGYRRALRQDYDPVPPLVLAPRFTTSHPNWLWLNRLQCLAVGRVTMADLIVRFDLYAIRVGEPLPSSGLPAVNAPPLPGDVHG
jgi:hypothetical protein